MDRTGSRETVLAGSVKGLLHIGMGIQSVLGLLWIFSNLGKLLEFEDSFRFLRWCEGHGLEVVGSRGGIILIQVVWLALAITASYLLVTAYFPRDKGRERLLKTLSLVTIPLVLPIHLALLPLSPLLSAAMTVWALLRKTENRQWRGIGILLCLLCVAAPGLGGRRSPAELVADRTLWPYVSVYYDRWPEEVRTLVTKDEALGVDRLAEGVTGRLSPILEGGLGEQRTGELYLEMARLALELRTREIGARILLDGLSYTFPPLGVRVQLAGGGYEAYTGRNYEIIKEHSPRLTRYYLEYGSWWFELCLVVAVLLFLCERIGKRKIYKERIHKERSGTFTKVLWVCMGVVILLFTLRGTGCMDFKDTGWIMVVWYVAFWKIGERETWKEIRSKK